MMILKFALQASVFCALLDGSRYGSEGATTTELAIGTVGGKLKVDQTPALARALAIVVRRVVSAAAGIFQPTILCGLR